MSHKYQTLHKMFSFRERPIKNPHCAPKTSILSVSIQLCLTISINQTQKKTLNPHKEQYRITTRSWIRVTKNSFRIVFEKHAPTKGQLNFPSSQKHGQQIIRKMSYSLSALCQAYQTSKSTNICIFLYIYIFYSLIFKNHHQHPLVTKIALFFFNKYIAKNATQQNIIYIFLI